MKVKLILGAVAAIVSFVGVSTAQNVAVFNGGIFVGLSPISATSGPQSGPNLTAFAGQTVRIRIEAVDASTASVIMGVPSSPSECNEASLFTRSASGTATNRGKLIVGVDNVELRVTTDVAWKGSCRILNVRLRDGSEHIGRMFFK